MKKNYKYIAAIFLGGLIGFSACTDDFESYNTNQAGFPDKSKEQEFNKYGIPLDSFWDLGFDMTADDGSTDFYKKPFYSSVENQAGAEDRLNFAYLSKPFRLSPKDIPVITYSAPIILEDGSVVGVFGLEMGLGRIEQVLSSDRTESSFEVCYALGVRQAGENTITPVASSGYLYNQYFKGDEYLNTRITRRKASVSCVPPTGPAGMPA